jgi:hypothetical protein
VIERPTASSSKVEALHSSSLASLRRRIQRRSANP